MKNWQKSYVKQKRFLYTFVPILLLICTALLVYIEPSNIPVNTFSRFVHIRLLPLIFALCGIVTFFIGNYRLDTKIEQHERLSRKSRKSHKHNKQ